MTQQRDEQAGHPAPRPSLTHDELRGLAYFAIGVTSEGGNQGYKLSVAGDNPSTPIVTPADDSGYTIGTLQTDMGWHPDVARRLVGAYQDWARLQTPDISITPQEERQTINDLSRHGRTITNRDHGRDIDATVKAHLNQFLASDEGVRFVHERDIEQVNKLMRDIVSPLQRTAIYTNSTPEDQAKLVTMVAKTYNQNETSGNTLLTNIARGDYQSTDEVKQAVNRLLPNRPNGEPDYIEQGVNHALKGTEVLNGLRNADARSPLNTLWQHVVADPLVNPVDLQRVNPQVAQQQAGPIIADPRQQGAVWQPAWEQQQAGPGAPPLRIAGANPNLPAEYDTVKTLFLSPDQGKSVIQALDQGGTYSYGRPQPEGRNRATAGFYVSGDEFVVWNQDGQGHAFIGGNWRDVDRQNLTRAKNNDGTIDINITENGTVSRLLHVDPRAPALRPDQQQEAVPQQQPGAPQMRGPGGGRPDRNGPDRDGPDQQQDRPQQGPRRAELMSDPGFDTLAHQTRLQTRNQLERTPIEGLGALSQDQRERLTANVAARVVGDVQTGMTNVTRIDASTIANPQTGMPQYLIPGQGDPTTAHYKRIAVDVAQAIDTPVERSSEIAKSGVEAREQKQTQDIAQAQSLNQDGPSGPAMKVGARTIAMASNAADLDGGA
jgi:hypothetical protein